MFVKNRLKERKGTREYCWLDQQEKERSDILTSRELILGCGNASIGIRFPAHLLLFALPSPGFLLSSGRIRVAKEGESEQARKWKQNLWVKARICPSQHT